MPFSDAVRVSLHPRRAYAELARGPGPAHFLELPLLSALLLGIGFAVVDSKRPSLRLVMGCAVAWSFLPALQIASVAASWFAFGRSRISLRRAIHFHFLGHLPWSLWLLAIAAVASAASPHPEMEVLELVSATVGIPFVWSRVIGWQFFRRVYGLGRGATLLATILHAAVVLGAILGFFLGTDQLVPRLLGGR